MTLTPGTVNSRLICRDLSASWQISRSTCSISVSRNSMWRRPACTVSASSSGSSRPRSHVASLDAEQVRDGRAALEPAHQHGVDLVLGPRARADQLLAAGQAPAHPGDPLRRHPYRLELARPQQLRQRARVQPVGLRPRLADAGIPGGHDEILLTCGSSSLTISHELPVTSSATRSLGRRLSASVSIPSGVEGTRPAEYTFPPRRSRSR